MFESISLDIGKIGCFFPLHRLLRILTKGDFDYVHSQRKSAIGGLWNGNIIQDIGINGSDMQTNLNATLKSNGLFVKGDAIIHFDDKAISVNCSGGFIRENTLKVSYISSDKSFIYFGVSLLELSPDGRKLEGRVVGYGHLVNQMIAGKVKILKD